MLPYDALPPKIPALYQKNLKRNKLGQSVRYISSPQSKWPHSYSHGCDTPNVSYNYHLFKVPQGFPNDISSNFLIMLSWLRSGWSNGFSWSHLYVPFPLGGWLVSVASCKSIRYWEQYAQLAVSVFRINQGEFKVLIKAPNNLLSVS